MSLLFYFQFKVKKISENFQQSSNFYKFGSRINQQKVERKQVQNKELAFLFWMKL